VWRLWICNFLEARLEESKLSESERRTRERTVARSYSRQRSSSTGLTGSEPLTGGLRVYRKGFLPHPSPLRCSRSGTTTALTKESMFFLLGERFRLEKDRCVHAGCCDDSRAGILRAGFSAYRGSSSRDRTSRRSNREICRDRHLAMRLCAFQRRSRTMLMESAVGDGGEERGTGRTTPKLPGGTFPGVPAVPKRRRWLDKEFAEYEIAAIVSAAMTRDAVLSTSDPFTILSRTLRARTYIRRHVRPKVVQGKHLAGRESPPKSLLALFASRSRNLPMANAASGMQRAISRLDSFTWRGKKDARATRRSNFIEL